MGNPILGTPNYIKSTFNTVTIGGGGWDTDSPLTNLRDPFYINNTISSSKAVVDTQLQIDLGSSRDIKLFTIPNSDISKAGLVRVHGSDTVSWLGVTVDGVNALNATTLNLSASAQANISSGDVFTIAGDTQVYQTTSAIGLGENAFTRSEEFDHADWSITGVAVTPDAVEAPNEVDTADTVLETAILNFHSVRQSATLVSGTKYTVSCYIKANGRTKIAIDGADVGVGAGNNATFDLSDGTVVDSGNAVSTIVNTVGDWYRCATTFTAVANVSTSFSFLFANAIGGFFYTGNATKGFDMWGAQIVVGEDALSYVMTSSTAAATTGSITLERVDSDGTGLAVATTGSEALTCHTGDYLSNTAVDTGWNDYFPILYPIGTDVWGGPTVWDGKVTDEELATLNLPRSYIYIFDEVILARYWKVEINDTSRSEDFVTIDAMYLASGFQPEKGMGFGSVQGLRSNSTKERSAGGVKITNSEPSERFVVANLQNLSVNEAFVNVFDTQRNLDIGEPFFFVTDSDDTTLMTRRAFDAEFETLDELSYTFYDNMEISLRIEEKLA